MDDAQLVMERSAGERLGLLVESFARLTGRTLIEDTAALWSAPFAVVAHGTEGDPIFFYGNACALRLFEMDARAFIALPSRLSAEPMLREERAQLLARVTRDGFIDDYAGVRISSTGRRFRIEQATVWNLIDAGGTRRGQAATFSRWTSVD